ncbi:glycosyltransferase family 2 protein [Agaribacter flavus]|uniref:Glycosyltransferase family 2 protein n=1 Tax=Agaribacter flavus TaxID=1902781 RepID=A0ABV7FRF8_9ALTE
MKKAGAIIILYYPEVDEVLNMLAELSSDLESVVLIDNTPIPMKIDFSQFSNVTHCKLGKNVGLASAQNQGLKHLLDLGCRFAFIFDQDTQIGAQYIKSMLQVWNDANDQMLAAIGPQIICEFSDTIESPVIQTPYRKSNGLHYVKQIISSGMMLDLDKIKDIGLKEDGLFIDAVDHEWCWRAGKYAYAVAQTPEVQIRHRMGVERKTLFACSYKVGQPIRHYYQVRNVLLLLTRPYVPFYWKIRNIGMIFVRLVLVILQGDNKLSRMSYIFQGLLDGLRRKSGKLNK